MIGKRMSDLYQITEKMTLKTRKSRQVLQLLSDRYTHFFI